MLIASGNLYLYGMFDDTEYTTDNSYPHFLFKTTLALSLDPLCQTMQVTESSVILTDGTLIIHTTTSIPNLVKTSSALSLNPLSPLPSSTISMIDVCFNDIAPFTTPPQTVTVNQEFSFTVGPFCSYRNNPITVTATTQGAASLPLGVTFDNS